MLKSKLRNVIFKAMKNKIQISIVLLSSNQIKIYYQFKMVKVQNFNNMNLQEVKLVDIKADQT